MQLTKPSSYSQESNQDIIASSPKDVSVATSGKNREGIQQVATTNFPEVPSHPIYRTLSQPASGQSDIGKMELTEHSIQAVPNEESQSPGSVMQTPKSITPAAAVTTRRANLDNKLREKLNPSLEVKRTKLKKLNELGNNKLREKLKKLNELGIKKLVN
jgi:hypothetical protein